MKRQNIQIQRRKSYVYNCCKKSSNSMIIYNFYCGIVFKTSRFIFLQSWKCIIKGISIRSNFSVIKIMTRWSIQLDTGFIVN